MTIPPREDAIYGDDEYIIDEMNKVEQELHDRIDHIRNTANTQGLDPVLAEALHRHMTDATTHLTSGIDTANTNVAAARERMAIAENAAGRTASINPSIAAGPQGSLASLAAGSQPARITGHMPSGAAGPAATQVTSGGMRGPSDPSGFRGTVLGPAQRPMQYNAATHTTSGGMAPQFTPPERATQGSPMRVPPTAYAPQTQYLPSSSQQGANWYSQAENARNQARASMMNQQPMQQPQAQQLMAAQNRAHLTDQARRDRAQSYLQSSGNQHQRAQDMRASMSPEQYSQHQEAARAQQQYAADMFRQQTAMENERYADMLREMESRSVEDLPTRNETSDNTIDRYADMTPAEFDSADDAERMVPEDVYNDMLRELMEDTETPEEETNQSSMEIGMNRDELKDAIYDILKEEDEQREAEAFASGPGSETGNPTGSVMPVSGDADDQAVIELANEYVAAQIPYAWGGGHGEQPGPSQGISDGGGYADQCGDYNKIGLDCSGLARDFTWNLYGVDINGTAATQYSSGTPIAPEDARPGDIFFPNSAGRPPAHVTVYIGNNSMLEAQQSGTLIMISPLPDGEFRRYVQ